MDNPSHGKLYDFLTRPFQREFHFFLFLLLMTAVVNTVSRMFYEGLMAGIYWWIAGFLQGYLVALLVPSGKLFRKCYIVFFSVLASLDFVVDVFVATLSTACFDRYADLVITTNVHEIHDFATHYLSIAAIAGIVVFPFVIYLLWRLLQKIHPVNSFKGTGLVAVPLCLLVYLFAGPHAMSRTAQNTFVGKFYPIAVEAVDASHDLERWSGHPDIVCDPDRLPENLIIFIGESASKGFDAHYGYGRETAPFTSMMPDSSLLIFQEAVSPEISTVASLKQVLTTYEPEDPVGCRTEMPWYTCVTLPAFLSAIGYETFWISNKVEGGFLDNQVTDLGRLCDTAVFTTAGLDFNGRLPYDEVLLDVLSSFRPGSKSGKRAFLMNNMGSHPLYHLRYPSDRSFFHPEDYPDHPANQRADRAAYDNSLRYTDSVLFEVASRFLDEETLGFYFSDHGMDVYVTDPSYNGQARRGDAVSEQVSREIPFYVFMSDRYRELHPDQVRSLYCASGRPFGTEDFIEALAGLFGAEKKISVPGD